MTIVGFAGLIMTVLGWFFNFGALLGDVHHVFGTL